MLLGLVSEGFRLRNPLANLERAVDEPVALGGSELSEGLGDTAIFDWDATRSIRT